MQNLLFFALPPPSNELLVQISSKFNNAWGFAGNGKNLQFEKTYKTRVQNQKRYGNYLPVKLISCHLVKFWTLAPPMGQC